jgi:hypothetical protein
MMRFISYRNILKFNQYINLFFKHSIHKQTVRIYSLLNMMEDNFKTQLRNIGNY